MPGEESLRQGRYYANRGNHFWKLLFAVFDCPFSEDYNDRMALVTQKRIALWDVLGGCERHGSLDSNIKNEWPNDFAAFFSKHTSIRYVFFSSKAAEKYYNKYAAKVFGITYQTLPSPSGANASISFAAKFQHWRVLSSL
jgi:hypoxanthine-DNA glycosylase